MKEYQVFPISNARTGFDEAVEPWLLPRDGYQVVLNAHLYRGVLEKIRGYQLYAIFTNRKILQMTGVIDGVNKTFTATLSPVPKSSNIFAISTTGATNQTLKYLSDASSTVINLSDDGSTIRGTVNITTGATTVTFATAPSNTTYTDVFIQWDSSPSVATAIMGIKQYYSPTGTQSILVFDQKRVGVVTNNMGVLASNNGAFYVVSELPHDYYQPAVFTGDGATVTFTTPGNATALAGVPAVPMTVFFTEYTQAGAPTGRVLQDNGSGVISNVAGPVALGTASGMVNYVTGAYMITFSVAPANNNYFTATTGIYGDLFTGSISNFFSLVNYMYYAFFTNNKDPIFYYDSFSVHYLPTNLTVKTITASAGVPTFGSTHGFDISKCLHVFVYRERLLLISPTVDGLLQQSTIYWSAQIQPLVFTNNELEPAETSQPIRAIGYINVDLVVRFSSSERVFRWTGDDTAPFRFDSTNNIWACDAPYSTINYDSWFSTVGKPAIVGSDAVNVRRVDEIIPDFTDPTRLFQDTPAPFMNQTSIQQCYGERFDDIKEGWLCYNSQPVDEVGVTPSDNILAFNYLDSTYATYSFPFSCLGFGAITNVPTWGTITTNWEDMNMTWDTYQLTSNSLVDLGGDQFDKVYQLNTGSTMGDGTTPVLMSVLSKNFNPFIEDGQLCRFGYLDLFVSADQITTLRVQFYVNDELYIDGSGNYAGFYQENMLRFTPTDAMSNQNQQVKVWKRIYIGAVAKTHTIRLYQNAADFTSTTLAQPVAIHAMNLYMKPAGRIFN